MLDSQLETTERIYKLIKRSSVPFAVVPQRDVLQQIASLTQCLPSPSQQWTEQQDTDVMQWLQEHYPNIYLWAISQHCVGHPAMVWGADPSLLTHRR
jgi:hypothetical protein